MSEERSDEKIPLAPGNRWTGLVLLFSTKTGEPLMIFPYGVLQRLRWWRRAHSEPNIWQERILAHWP